MNYESQTCRNTDTQIKRMIKIFADLVMLKDLQKM